MYREFILRSPANWQQFVAVVKANAKAFADKGKPLRIILTSEEQTRNVLQNRRLWAIYKTISEQAFVNGQNFSTDVWHEMFARKFGVCDEVILPDGEIVIRRKSTTQMSVAEFSEYMDRVESYAAQELGVSFAEI
jgi:hypothetical protein